MHIANICVFRSFGVLFWRMWNLWFWNKNRHGAQGSQHERYQIGLDMCKVCTEAVNTNVIKYIRYSYTSIIKTHNWSVWLTEAQRVCRLNRTTNENLSMLIWILHSWKRVSGQRSLVMRNCGNKAFRMRGRLQLQSGWLSQQGVLWLGKFAFDIALQDRALVLALVFGQRSRHVGLQRVRNTSL